MSGSILGKAEVGSSILPGGTTSPYTNKESEARPHPTPHVLTAEHGENAIPARGEFAGSSSRGVPLPLRWRYYTSRTQPYRLSVGRR